MPVHDGRAPCRGQDRSRPLSGVNFRKCRVGTHYGGGNAPTGGSSRPFRRGGKRKSRADPIPKFQREPCTTVGSIQQGKGHFSNAGCGKCHGNEGAVMGPPPRLWETQTTKDSHSAVITSLQDNRSKCGKTNQGSTRFYDRD